MLNESIYMFSGIHLELEQMPETPWSCFLSSANVTKQDPAFILSSTLRKYLMP